MYPSYDVVGYAVSAIAFRTAMAVIVLRSAQSPVLLEIPD